MKKLHYIGIILVSLLLLATTIYVLMALPEAAHAEQSLPHHGTSPFAWLRLKLELPSLDGQALLRAFLNWLTCLIP